MPNAKTEKLNEQYHYLKQLCDKLEVLLGTKQKTVKLKIKISHDTYHTMISFYKKKYNSLQEQCYSVPLHLNKGEKAEIKCIKTMLIHKCTNNVKYFNKLFGTSITSTDAVTIFNPGDTKQLTSLTSVNKASSGYKNDITVKIDKNVFRISIKTLSNSPPAIMNHTPRTANIFKEGGILHHIVPTLDKIISRYITNRNTGIFKEDVDISALNLSKSEKDAMIVLLSYFVFEGTGQKLSKESANCVYEIASKSDKVYICNTAETKNKYVENLLSKCKMSLRLKGMPKKIKEYNVPWLYKKSGVCKGSLHIRIK